MVSEGRMPLSPVGEVTLAVEYYDRLRREMDENRQARERLAAALVRIRELASQEHRQVITANVGSIAWRDLLVTIDSVASAALGSGSR